MKGNAFNELWELISNAEASFSGHLPDKFLDFVKSSMVPDAESDGGLQMSGDEPVVSDTAKELLASLYLTYWAESVAQRRSYAQQLHERELAYAKEEPSPMTEEETLYWHNDDKSSWSSTREIEDFYKRAVVIKDGHFSGALVNTRLQTGMGLSVYRDQEYGILFVDGSKAGRTYEHEYRSSDESSYSKTTTYTLKRK